MQEINCLTWNIISYTKIDVKLKNCSNVCRAEKHVCMLTLVVPHYVEQKNTLFNQFLSCASTFGPNSLNAKYCSYYSPINATSVHLHAQHFTKIGLIPTFPAECLEHEGQQTHNTEVVYLLFSDIVIVGDDNMPFIIQSNKLMRIISWFCYETAS